MSIFVFLLKNILTPWKQTIISIYTYFLCSLDDLFKGLKNVIIYKPRDVCFSAIMCGCGCSSKVVSRWLSSSVSWSLYYGSYILQRVCFSSFHEEAGLRITLVVLTRAFFFVHFLLKKKHKALSPLLILYIKLFNYLYRLWLKDACSNDVYLLG